MLQAEADCENYIGHTTTSADKNKNNLYFITFRIKGFFFFKSTSPIFGNFFTQDMIT